MQIFPPATYISLTSHITATASTNATVAEATTRADYPHSTLKYTSAFMRPTLKEYVCVACNLFHSMIDQPQSGCHVVKSTIKTNSEL